MKVVSSGLGNVHFNSPAKAPVFRVEGTSEQLKFAEQFSGWKVEGRSAGLRNRGGSAVNQNLLSASSRARHCDFASYVVYAWHVSNESARIANAAREEWESVEELRRNVLSAHGRRGFEELSIRCNFYRLLHIANLERQRNFLTLRDTDFNIGPRQFLKTGFLRGNRIRADRKASEQEQSGFSCSRLEFLARWKVLGDDSRSRYHCSICIGYQTTNRTGRRLAPTEHGTQ